MSRHQPATPIYSWSKIEHAGRTFHLRRPIQVQVEFSDDLWIHQYQPLDILAYSPSKDRSLDNFQSEFAACWDLIALASDRNLSEGAIDLKKKLLDLVERVEERG